MFYIGCHLSASDGFLAMGRTALSIGANTFQFFTRNPRGSKAKAIDPADVAAVLALTMWRAGTLEQILHTGQQLNTWLPQTTQQTEPELLGKPVNDKAPQQSTAPLGKPIEDKKQLTEKLSDALDALLHHSADTTEK